MNDILDSVYRPQAKRHKAVDKFLSLPSGGEGRARVHIMRGYSRSRQSLSLNFKPEKINNFQNISQIYKNVKVKCSLFTPWRHKREAKV